MCFYTYIGEYPMRIYVIYVNSLTCCSGDRLGNTVPLTIYFKLWNVIVGLGNIYVNNKYTSIYL